MSSSNSKGGSVISEPESNLELYIGSIGDPERLEYQFSTVQEVLLEIQLLGSQRTRSRANEALRILTPFISFIDRYSTAVDVMVQYMVSPSCLIWGCLRVILKVGQSLPYYFDDLLHLVGRFGFELCLYNRYDQLFHGRGDFRVALSDTYMDALIFLRKARDALRANGGLCIFISSSSPDTNLSHLGSITAWFRRVWKNFEQEFAEILQRLGRRLESLSLLSAFIHRDNVHRDLQKQEEFRTQASQALDRIVSSSTCQPPPLRDQLSQNILSWLSPVDYHEDWRRNVEKCTPKTCQWIFGHPFFQAWTQDTAQHVGWVYGNAGIGKTVLSASIIKQLDSAVASQGPNSTMVAYFFFDETDESRNSTLAMFRAILFQLTSRLPSCIECIEAAFVAARNYGRSHMTWLDRPSTLLRRILAMPTRIFIVLDGLDECRDIGNNLAEFLDVIQSSAHCRVLFLSRDVPHIRDALTDCQALSMTQDLTKGDIDVYFSSVIQGLSIPEGQHRNKMLSQLSAGADGMFLWAHFMTQELKSAVCPEDVAEAAATTPRGLKLYYELVLKKLASEPPKWLELAQNVFLRVLCSPRPLTWAELQCSLTLDETPGESGRRKGRLPYKSAVLKVCLPFIEYHSDGDYFRPAHVSVHQFLMTPAEDDTNHGLRISMSAGHQKIAKILLNYLHELQLQGGAVLGTSTYPLMAYATSYWCHHLLSSELDTELCDRAKLFLSSDSRRRTWLMQWLLMDRADFPLYKIFRVLRKVRNQLEENMSDNHFWYDELQDILLILIQLDEGRLQSRPATDAMQINLTISNSYKIMIIRDLARMYMMANRLDDGISHFKEGMARIERTAGAKPEDSIWILNGLGILYDQQGLVDLAVETQQRALAIQNDSLRSNEFDEILTINELGRLYRHLGKFAKSQEMHLRALRSLRAMFPDTDIQEVWTMSHLAKCYRMDGRLDAALKLHNEVLAMRTRLLGLDHPHTLWDVSDVAKCHRDLRALAEACRIQEDSVQRREKVLGPKHNDTLWAMNDLGLMYEKAGRLEDALHLHLKAWEGQKLTLGQVHDTTVWSFNEIQKLRLITQKEDVV